jgi:hypothetical protein
LYDIVTAQGNRGWSDWPDPRVRTAVLELDAAGLVVTFQGRVRPSDAVIASLALRLWPKVADLVKQWASNPPATQP